MLEEMDIWIFSEKLYTHPKMHLEFYLSGLIRTFLIYFILYQITIYVYLTIDQRWMFGYFISYSPLFIVPRKGVLIPEVSSVCRID